MLKQRLDAVAFWLLLAVVCLAPLPLASNRPMPLAILTLAAGVVFALACISMLLRDEGPAFARALKFACACFVLVGVWVLFQLATFLPSPLPHPLWSDASRILGRAIPGRITLDATQTWTTLAATAGYFAIGASAVLLIRGDKRPWTAALVLCLSGGAYALYGLVMHWSGNEMVLWYPKTDYVGVVTSTFINRNSYATYAGLVSLLCLGLIIADIGELRHLAAANAAERATRVSELLLRRRWSVVLSLIFLLASLLLTLSRGGIGAFFFGASALLFLLTYAGVLSRRMRWRAFAIFAAGSVCAIILFGQAFVERVSSDGLTADDDRREAWSIAVDGIETSPLLGHGFGAFPEGFPLYRDDRLPSRRFWDKAHDTYLELAFDLGLPAAAVLLAGFVALAAQTWKGLKRRRHARRALPAVGLAAMLLAGSHSLVDFSLQIPADAAIFAFLVGLAIAESGIWSGAQRETAA
jgi:O-antigen ligase